MYGYKKTGITIMFMDKGMDTGDMISKCEVDILDTDTAETLHDKLSEVSVTLLLNTIPKIINGTNERIKQNEEEATYAYNVSREEEHIDFNKKKDEIYNQIRGLNSWPGAYCNLDNKIIKIWESKKSDKKYNEENGKIIDITKDGIIVSVCDGSILITNLQLEGKKKVNIKDFINGIKKEDYIGKILM